MDPATTNTSTLVPYNPQAQAVSGPSVSTVVETCPSPGGLGFSFFAGSGLQNKNGGTVSIPFQMAVDSGATFHYLDDELLPKIEHDMIDFVRMDLSLIHI